MTTPQAIAAVRGSKWAGVTAAQKTSVFVVNGRVAVARRSADGQRVILGPGEGVDVEGRYSPRRRSAGRLRASRPLMARLGQ